MTRRVQPWLIKLTAGDVEIASLLVKREEREIHGAEAGQGDPDAVEHVAVGKHPDIEVGGQDVVEGPDLLVPEESVRHPDLARVREGQVADPL